MIIWKIDMAESAEATQNTNTYNVSAETMREALVKANQLEQARSVEASKAEGECIPMSEPVTVSRLCRLDDVDMPTPPRLVSIAG